ncbi:MAG: hypothetical protein QHH13_12860 [Melioribacter sp.]|uniref:DUF6249 domain-containing protein n=1 Tax=Rosettibacter primus TaxID=3111523 RepID=UPI00247EB360|nr:hypothetical protein [Melioribacter sp.]
MGEGLIALFIPIVAIVVTGIVLVTFFYFRSKEKQLMIEKGLSYDQMIELLKSRRDAYSLLKAGIIILFFGIGLGTGVLIEGYTGIDEWVPLLIFVMLGLGFVVAFFVARKLGERDKKRSS